MAIETAKLQFIIDRLKLVQKFIENIEQNRIATLTQTNLGVINFSSDGDPMNKHILAGLRDSFIYWEECRRAEIGLLAIGIPDEQERQEKGL